jgi:hypothetical protein
MNNFKQLTVNKFIHRREKNTEDRDIKWNREIVTGYDE